MIIDKTYVINAFIKFNEDFFGSSLPIPNIVIRHSYRTLGYFKCDLDEYNNVLNPTIEISDNYDYTESQFRDILMHEMIHYLLVYNGKDIKCKHGKEFKKAAKLFNSTCFMNITPTIDLMTYKIRKGKSSFMYKFCTLF